MDLKCRILYANPGGRALYGNVGEPTKSLDTNTINFEVHRLCFKLKQMAEAQRAGGIAVVTKPISCFAIGPGNLRHKINASFIAKESTKEPCILVLVEAEDQRASTKLNLAHYQSTYQLTRREIQILELLSKGGSYKEIAYTLTISAHTVRDHIKSIRFKLRADGKCGILARLIENAGLPEDSISHASSVVTNISPIPSLPSEQSKKRTCTVAEKVVITNIRHSRKALPDEPTTRISRAKQTKAGAGTGSNNASWPLAH